MTEHLHIHNQPEFLFKWALSFTAIDADTTKPSIDDSRCSISNLQPTSDLAVWKVSDWRLSNFSQVCDQQCSKDFFPLHPCLTVTDWGISFGLKKDFFFFSSIRICCVMAAKFPLMSVGVLRTFRRGGTSPLCNSVTHFEVSFCCTSAKFKVENAN